MAPESASVALRLGFVQGRFGAYYQEAFGESPSVTLRRERRGSLRLPNRVHGMCL